MKDIKREISARGPYEFFDKIRHGSQAFQGITNETMTHGEAYEFIQIGKHLERADKTVRIIDVKYASVNQLREGPESSLQLIAMLRSCSAFEAFRKAHLSQLQPARVAEFLLFNQQFPRAVAYCLQRALRSIALMSEDAKHPTGPHRSLGRICSELDYVDINEVLGVNMRPYLNRLLNIMNQAGDEITRTYFHTQVILPAEYHPGSNKLSSNNRASDETTYRTYDVVLVRRTNQRSLHGNASAPAGHDHSAMPLFQVINRASG